MQLIFADLNPVVIEELRQAFTGIPEVTFHRMQIGQALRMGCGFKAVINAGNGSGLSDSGTDGAISRSLSTPWSSMQDLTQKRIDENYMGQQPVGTALMISAGEIDTSLSDMYMIYAPTMLIPEDVAKSYNAYAAFRASLLEVWRHNLNNPTRQIATVICSGLATGAGSMNPHTSAQQMRVAWDSLIHPISHDWKSAWNHHRKLLKSFE